MAGFLRSFTNAVSGLVKSAFSGNPYEVDEISSQQLQKVPIMCQDESMTLYRDGTYFFAVLHRPESSSKLFCLFRVNTEGEGMTTFSSLSSKLKCLYMSSKRIFNKEMLQLACDTIRHQPSWSSAHIAAKLGLNECFRNNIVSQYIEAVCEVTQAMPIHIAIESGHMECIQELLVCGAKLDLADRSGDNVFHYAAKSSNANIIQMLASKDASSVNQLNLYGESPLHAACLSDQPENAEQLLRWNADPMLTMSGRYPIHCAMKVASLKCIEVLCRWNKSQIHAQDTRYGGTPLHWAKNRQCIFLLADLGCNFEVTNTEGETALHIMIRRNRLACVMAMLSRGAKSTAICNRGNSLHLAVETDNIDMVQALIVFGADFNGRNNLGATPRHMISTGMSKNKDVLLYLVHRVGAKRCPPGTSDCNVGCANDGSFDGTPPGGKVVSTPSTPKKVYDSIVDDVAMAAALTRSASASGSAIMGGDTMDWSPTGARSGDRILCLDGGGIRGLVLIQLLLAIEKAAGQPIRNCFDWIGGTSTGGILALAIVHGKSIEYAQGLYFRLKDEVFSGRRPYASEPLERFMKREFGENTRMTEIEYPKVLVTGVLGDRHPSELHFFRNYEKPGLDYKEEIKNSTFEPCPRPNEQFVWRAARCSGAAPTYFRAMGRFLDGGLMANNPTLDVLTEVHEYNMGLKATNQGELVQKLHTVVSLGTGKIPLQPVKACDVFRPEGLFDIARVAFGATALGQLLVEQATQAEGRPVDRARAWCSMIDVPYFRFSPQLSEDIPLDCHDDTTIVQMLWETQCYIHDNSHKISQLAMLLKS